MIISASRRTDIPAFYGEWFINRLKAGYLLVRNPFNPQQVRRVDLTSETLDGIVFWTKDPATLLPYLDEIDAMGFIYYFQFTLTSYGPDMEPHLRPKQEILRSFIDLSRRVGSSRVLWRYDPIVFNSEMDCDYHIRIFTHLCQQLSGYTDQVIISFVDLYRGIAKTGIREATAPEIANTAEALARIAKAQGIEIAACCETHDLSVYGISKASCIDQSRIASLGDSGMPGWQQRSLREGCGCAASVDVGAYNTCLHGCIYCYATRSLQSAARNHQRHDPLGEHLLP